MPVSLTAIQGGLEPNPVAQAQLANKYYQPDIDDAIDHYLNKFGIRESEKTIEHQQLIAEKIVPYEQSAIFYTGIILLFITSYLISRKALKKCISK